MLVLLEVWMVRGEIRGEGFACCTDFMMPDLPALHDTLLYTIFLYACFGDSQFGRDLLKLLDEEMRYPSFVL